MKKTEKTGAHRVRLAKTEAAKGAVSDTQSGEKGVKRTKMATFSSVVLSHRLYF